MAIKVEFTGYVNEVKSFSWGVIAKVSHNQVKKADDGSWETVGRDYFDVVLPAGVSVSENERVDVVGRLKTKSFDKKDGSKGVSLEVRADSVTVAQSARANVSVPRQSATPVSEEVASWLGANAKLIEDAPF